MEYSALDRLIAINRFERQVWILQSGCHEWGGARVKAGYGVLRFKGKNMLAHRFLLEVIHKMPLKKSDIIKHTCGNNACVNREHLEIHERRK